VIFTGVFVVNFSENDEFIIEQRKVCKFEFEQLLSDRKFIS
jgi:hypothetical protein